jgi:hypothetical protein
MQLIPASVGYVGTCMRRGAWQGGLSLCGKHVSGELERQNVVGRGLISSWDAQWVANARDFRDAENNISNCSAAITPARQVDGHCSDIPAITTRMEKTHRSVLGAKSAQHISILTDTSHAYIVVSSLLSMHSQDPMPQR